MRQTKAPCSIQMKKILDATFSLVNLVLVVATLVLSFKGHHFAFVSFAGYFLSMTAVGTILGVWINPGKEHETYLTKILTSLVGILLILVGNWIIKQGGLVSITLSALGTGDKFTFMFADIIWFTGLLAALRGTHKKTEIGDNVPGTDSPLEKKVEYLLRMKIETSRREVVVNLASTILALISIVYPIYSAVSLGNAFQLILLLLFPLCAISMGLAINGGHLWVYLPTVAPGVLLITLAAPWWY